MKIKTAAKINLTLDIVGVRDDGYHLIDSVFQAVSLYDYLEIEKSDNIFVSFSDTSIDGSTSLVYKSALRFFEYTNIVGGATIKVSDNIPTSSGMGGGSSDAAATLVGLNKLYGTKLNEEELCEIGIKIGADVPFFIVGVTSRVEGIGEKITPIAKAENYPIVIIKDKKKLSTGFMYGELDKKENKVFKTKNMIKAIENNDISSICDNVSNAFLSVCDIKEEEKLLLSLGALGVGLSGSGPSVYGIFKDENTAKLCFEELKITGHNVYLADLCDKAIEIIE